MMISDYTSPRDLSYGLTPEDLVFDEGTLDMAPDLDAMDLMCELTGPDYIRHDSDAANRTLNMAIALYEKLVMDPDNHYDGLSRNDLFGACLYQATIWEMG